MNTTYDFAFSEQGYNHIKADKVCQDSSGHYSDDLMAVVVVADGHGSDNYPRTDRGSSFAVEATITAIREFVKTVEDSVIDISEDSDSYLEQLAKNILAIGMRLLMPIWRNILFRKKNCLKLLISIRKDICLVKGKRRRMEQL